MSYGNQGYRQQATMAASPFANSIRQQVVPTQGFLSSGIGSLKNLLERRTRDVPQENVYGNMVGSLSQGTPDPMPMDLSRPAQLRPARPEPVNPFAENEQYQALMEYQKSMAPQQEQLDRLNELRTAFEGTGGYKDYRIQQMEQQMQRMQQPRMGMGLGGMRPTGMGMFGGFPQQPQRQFGQMPMRQPMVTPRGGFAQYNQMNQPRQFGAMGYNQPQQNPYQQQPYQQQQYGMMGGYQQNPYQQMRPQPQQFGGYGMSQNMGGYGGYGGMQNSYAPQQYGQQNMGQPQQFGRMY